MFFSPEGRLYIGGLGGFDTTPPSGADSMVRGRSIIVAESLDGGLSWESPVTIAQGSGTVTRYGAVERSEGFVNHDRPWFAAGPGGFLLVAWNELGHDGDRTTLAGASTATYDGNEFQYSISRDGGSTWTGPITLTNGGWPGALVRDDGSFVLGHSSHMDGRITLFTPADGVDWQEQVVGSGLHAAMLTDHDGDILVSTTGVLDGAYHPAYYRVGPETTGPWMYGAAQELAPSNHMVSDPAGGFWSMWLPDNGTVNVAKFDDASAPWPSQRHVVAAIDGRLGAYGNYVYTLGVSDSLYLVWSDLVGDDRQLYAAVV